MLTFSYIMGLWQKLTEAMNEKKINQKYTKFTKISQYTKSHKKQYQKVHRWQQNNNVLSDLKSTLQGVPKVFIHLKCKVH